jgi:hypothetical protein
VPYVASAAAPAPPAGASAIDNKLVSTFAAAGRAPRAGGRRCKERVAGRGSGDASEANARGPQRRRERGD